MFSLTSRMFAYRPVIMLCAASATLSCDPHRGLENDAAARSAMQRIHRAEKTYMARSGRYGELNELGPAGAGLIDAKMAAGRAVGFEFVIVVSKSGYGLTASPQVIGKTGHRSFYCDESGTIRSSWSPAVATKDSPPIN